MPAGSLHSRPWLPTQRCGAGSAVVGAFLEAQAGDYASAAQSLTMAAQATPSSGEAGELLALAELFAERATTGFRAGGVHVSSSAVEGGDLSGPAVRVLGVEEPEGLRVVPNPTSQPATATLTLSAPARVRLSVYDALGREVVRLADSPLTRGRHAFAVVGALPAGTYLIRAVVEPEGGTRRLFTQRFTLTR